MKHEHEHEHDHGHMVAWVYEVWLIHEILNHMHGCNGPGGHVSKLVDFPKQEVDLLTLHFYANHHPSYL